MISSLLIESIKRIASAPSIQGRFTDEIFLSICDEEVLSGIVPLIIEQKEDYFSFDHDITLKEGKFSYLIPSKAIAGKLREVAFITPDNITVSIPRLELNEIGNNPGLEGFYIKNNKVVLNYSKIDTSKKLRLTFFIRPSSLVLPEKCRKIISKTCSNGQTILEIESPLSSLEVSLVDIVRNGGSYECLAIEQEPNVSGTTYIFEGELEDVKKGDIITVSGQSPFPQIPEELHPLLAQKAACKVLASLGETQGYAVAKADLDKMEQDAIKLLSTRVEGESRTIRNKLNPLRYI